MRPSDVVPSPAANSAGTVLYTRVRPGKATLTEIYYYRHELSRNPDIDTSEPAIGRIEIAVPFDGHKHFTPQAISDVRRQLRGVRSDPAAAALIGYLGVVGDESQGLQELLEQGGAYGTIPLHIPLPLDAGAALDVFLADEHTFVFEFAYSPLWPDDVPHVAVTIHSYDEDQLSRLELDASTETGRKRADDVARDVATQMSFRPHLVLKTSADLRLPDRLEPGDLRPRVARMSLAWPTITSSRSLALRVGDDDLPVRYNPTTRSIEWSDVPMTERETPNAVGLTSFGCDMLLQIDHPGELYEWKVLKGELEIEIPGRLLSGLEARIYQSTGDLIRQADLKLERKTRVVSRFRLFLDDMFSRRMLSPFQHLHFEEVVPDRMRIADIETALNDRGFRIRYSEATAQSKDGGELNHFILAQRPEGPDMITLAVVVNGRHHTTERQTKIRGGQTYTTTAESGEVYVYVRGEMPSNSRRLTQEMNALHEALRGRFERTRAKR